VWRTIGEIAAIVFVLIGYPFMKWRTRRWSEEITRRGDARAKEDQTGPWVRRG